MTEEQEEKARRLLKERLKDKTWRMNNLYYIKDKDGKKIRFKYNFAQALFLAVFHVLSIILKARQQGFTTLSCISFLDDCLFTPNLSAGIIAHNLEDAKDFFENKIKFAYDNLPDDIKELRKADTSSKGKLKFSNGSSIRVRTSFRSGTLQRLHISEFGKICAKSPEKAKEIMTGALQAIATGQVVIIESTAEGKVGHFYDMCQDAISKARRGDKLTDMDFKFHFFPWHQSKEYQLDPEGVLITSEMAKYFNELESDHGIKLTAAQKAWYVKKKEILKDGMQQEYPSYADEAFSQAIEGAYYGKQMVQAETQKRIGNVPWEPLLKVHVSYDLGINDAMALWFFQVERSGARRYINFYSNTGEGIPHYVAKMNEFKNLFGYDYGKIILPHDAKVRELGTGKSRVEVFESLGVRDIEIIPALSVAEGIDTVRSLLPKCWFDLAKCKDGIKALSEYRKAWDEKAGVWKDKPLHDWTSNPADSFRMSAVVDLVEIPLPTQRKSKNKFR